MRLSYDSESCHIWWRHIAFCHHVCECIRTHTHTRTLTHRPRRSESKLQWPLISLDGSIWMTVRTVQTLFTAACCNSLQLTATHPSQHKRQWPLISLDGSIWMTVCVVGCELQWVAMSCNELQWVAMSCSELQWELSPLCMAGVGWG